MKEHVTKRDGTLAVLVSCPTDKKPDGFTIDSGAMQSISVHVLPATAWNSFSNEQRWRKFTADYGQVSQVCRAGLLALTRLSQALRTRSIRVDLHNGEIRASASEDLHAYLKLQAAAYARSKRPLPLDPPGRWGDAELQYEQIFNEIALPPGNPAAHFDEQLRPHLRAGRLVMWWSAREGTLAPGLYFRDLEDGLFALLALQSTLPEGSAICERCGNCFQRCRKTQKFCSVKCGNYMRKKLERSRSSSEKHT